MTRKLNNETIECAKRWEEFIPYAYDDADTPRQRKPVVKGQKLRGTLTVGFGHTGSDVYPGQTVSLSEANELLRKDLAKAAAAVEQAVRVELTDNQFGALTIFTLNVGTQAFKDSTLVRKLNTGDYASVPAELMRWNKTTIAGKKVVSQGLVNRRAAEAGLWAKGSFVKSTGSPVEVAKEPLVSKDAVAMVSAFGGGSALQFVPKDGPIAWVLAGVIALAAIVLIVGFIQRRRG